MGRENLRCGGSKRMVKNRSLETLKMTMRSLYSIFIWYEFWYHPE